MGNLFFMMSLIQRHEATSGYCLCPATTSRFHFCKLNSMNGRDSSRPTGTGLLIRLTSRVNLRYMFSHSRLPLALTGSEPAPACSLVGDMMAKSFFTFPQTE